VAILDGLPAGVAVDAEQINMEMARRQRGYGRGGRMKIEQDSAQILSGIRHGLTIGSPIALLIENKDSANWTKVMSVTPADLPDQKSRRLRRTRPSHADLAGGLKFNTRDLRNILERASARKTAARVACGALAKQLLISFGVEIRSLVVQLGSVPKAPLEISWDAIDAIPKCTPPHQLLIFGRSNAELSGSADTCKFREGY
jgi:chorismate synthase